MDRAQKAEAVESLKGLFAEAGVVVVSHYTGLTVAEMSSLRTKLRESNASLKVVKNRLAKIALKGTPNEAAADLFTGQVAIAFAQDPVDASKAMVAFAKENEKLVLVGGVMDGEVMDASGVDALSKMPSREELIATVAARLLGQASQIGQRVAAPGQGLAGAITAIGEQAAA